MLAFADGGAEAQRCTGQGVGSVISELLKPRPPDSSFEEYSTTIKNHNTRNHTRCHDGQCHRHT